MELKVLSNGYLKDAQITVDNQNFFLETKLPKDDQIKENIIGDNINKIDFNQISNGTQKTITGMIKSERWDDEKGTISAIGEDTTKYGEFISSYFAWVSLPEQKEKVEKLQNITKKREK